jgi:hypothetical protein
MRRTLLKAIKETFANRKFNTQCISTIQFKTLKFNSNNPKGSIRGSLVELKYYDTHKFEPSIEYTKSAIETVLVLPGSSSLIGDHKEYIDELYHQKKRVIVLQLIG